MEGQVNYPNKSHRSEMGQHKNNGLKQWSNPELGVLRINTDHIYIRIQNFAVAFLMHLLTKLSFILNC